MHTILVIGCGSIGERHLRCFQQTKRAAVTVCDTNPALVRTMVETYGAAEVADWEHAVASGRFGAAVICTPAHLHVPMAIRVLEAGMHVLIEKPLSQSLAGIDRLQEVHARSGRQAAVAYVYHAFPLFNAVRDFIRGSGIGPVRHVVCTSGQCFPKLRPQHALHYAQTYYRDHRTGGGAIQDALTHTVNWIESVIGPTDSVLCDSAHQVLPGVTVEDTVNVSARHGDILVNYTLNQFQAPNEAVIQFHAAAGSVKIELQQNRWGVFRENDDAWTWHPLPTAERDAHFIAQAGHFLDQIEGRPARLCSLAAAAQSLRFNLAALASSAAGARVHTQSLHA